MLTPVNHAPTPVMEGVSPGIAAPLDCAKLKADFNIETGSHKENKEGPTKKNSPTYQSHHILQDAATNGIVEAARSGTVTPGGAPVAMVRAFSVGA